MDGAHANAHETAPCINPCMWSGEEAENLKKPILVPAKLLAPTEVRGWSGGKAGLRVMVSPVSCVTKTSNNNCSDFIDFIDH